MQRWPCVTEWSSGDITFTFTSIPQTHPVHVDRPFVFLSRDNQTGALLFLGHVVDPR